MKVDTECSACRGTGIYRGFAEPPGVGVVCLNCEGIGCRTMEYTPFTGRRTRDDIKEVQRSRGSFIGTGVGPVGRSISYQDFLNSKKV